MTTGLAPIPRSRVRQAVKFAMAAALPKRYFIVHGDRQCGAIALTFDDGPDPDHTPKVLDVLRENNVKATFFLIGQKIEWHPEIVLRIAGEGHSIGHHSYWHQDPAETSAKQLLDETEQTIAILEHVLGSHSTLFRPPHGKLKPGAMLGLMSMSQRVVLWNRDPRDYRASSADELCDAMLADRYEAGDIILLHDRIPHTADALRRAIPGIRERHPHLRFATIDSLVN